MHLSLAVLELLVHTDPGTLPDTLTAYAIDVPVTSVEILAVESLPAHWRSDAAETRRVGDAWLRTGRTLALTVPSAVVSSDAERTVLLNPAHLGARALKVVSSEQFSFDHRLRR
jgi:RES domain-containing protein